MDAAAALMRCARLARSGRVVEAAGLYASIDPSGLTPGQRRTGLEICLGILTDGAPATRGLFDRLADIPHGLRPDLRYRAFLAHRRYTAAGAFRRQMIERVGDDVRTDWRWTLALAALERGHLRAGLALYPARFTAINRPESVPAPQLRHVPMAQGARETVFLEQGLGDTLLHLCHLKALRGTDPLIITGIPRWRPVIARWFPGWSFVALDDLDRTVEANASGDVLALALARRGHLRPGARLARSHRARVPRIGLIWRGGTRPNRPAERRLDLRALLDLLPRGPRYLALQHDMTAEERGLIAAHPGIDLPGFDPVLDLETLIDCVAGLAGVIGVDGSLVHLAGCIGVPACVLMNDRPHWYWGRYGRAAGLYPGATSLRLAAPDRTRLRAWVRARPAAWTRRPPAPALLSVRAARPVLITGAPRAGGGLVLAALAQRGLWCGSAARNIRHALTHPLLGDRLMGRMLELFLSADPHGLTGLPADPEGFAAPHWQRLVARVLAADGYSGARAWALWDPRITLTWPFWDAAFPGAVWVLADTGREPMVRACLSDPPAGAGGGRDAAFWRLIHEAYAGRCARLADAVSGPVVRIRPAADRRLYPSDLSDILDAAGVEPPLPGG